MKSLESHSVNVVIAKIIVILSQLVGQGKLILSKCIHTHYTEYVGHVLTGMIFTGQAQVVQVVASAQAICIFVVVKCSFSNVIGFTRSTTVIRIHSECQLKSVDCIHCGQLPWVRLLSYLIITVAIHLNSSTNDQTSKAWRHVLNQIPFTSVVFDTTVQSCHFVKLRDFCYCALVGRII